MDNNNLIIAVVVIIVALVVVFYPSYENNKLTGSATEISVGSSASVSNYFAIAASSTLATDGIRWSSILTLPVTDLNADGNNINPTPTNYFISVSTDSNVNVDLCTKADGPLTSGVNTIALTNYKWDSNIVATGPVVTAAVAMTTIYASADLNIAPSGSDYYRFWLSVPASQAAGTYTNVISFKGVQTGNAC